MYFLDLIFYLDCYSVSSSPSPANSIPSGIRLSLFQSVSTRSFNKSSSSTDSLIINDIWRKCLYWHMHMQFIFIIAHFTICWYFIFTLSPCGFIFSSVQLPSASLLLWLGFIKSTTYQIDKMDVSIQFFNTCRFYNSRSLFLNPPDIRKVMTRERLTT